MHFQPLRSYFVDDILRNLKSHGIEFDVSTRRLADLQQQLHETKAQKYWLEEEGENVKFQERVICRLREEIECVADELKNAAEDA